MSQFSALLPLLSQLNSHDEREDFIYALKPLLSKERQRKAEQIQKGEKRLHQRVRRTKENKLI